MGKLTSPAGVLSLSLLVSSCAANYYPLTTTLNAPVVINTPFTYDVTTTDYTTSPPTTTVTPVQVSPAWFQVSGWTFDNEGTSEITIVSLSISVNVPPAPATSGTGTSGTSGTNGTSGTSGTSGTNAATTTASCVIAPNATLTTTTSVTQNFLLDLLPKGAANSANIGTIPANQYCEGLNFPTNLANSAYITSGLVIVNGWEGPPTGPTQRLNVKPITFTTQ